MQIMLFMLLQRFSVSSDLKMGLERTSLDFGAVFGGQVPNLYHLRDSTHTRLNGPYTSKRLTHRLFKNIVKIQFKSYLKSMYKKRHRRGRDFLSKSYTIRISKQEIFLKTWSTIFIHVYFHVDLQTIFIDKERNLS